MQSDLIFDVGLHLGEDTDFYLKKGFRVIAFEANGDFVRKCQGRFSSAISDNRLVIVHGAVAPGTSSTLPFYVNLKNTEWGTLNLQWVERNERWGAPSKKIEVPRIDLTEHFRRYGIPYYLKIDIEGLDTQAAVALNGFSDRPQFVSIESDHISFRRAVDEIELLRSLGYRKFKPVQQGNCYRMALRALDGSPFEHEFEIGSSGVFGDDLPGEWLDYKSCSWAYRKIFATYRSLGHLSPFWKDGKVRFNRVRGRLERLTGTANALGWHDLHASL